LVERFGLVDWRGLLDLLTTGGPEELIYRTRQAELAETDDEQATRRGKKHDDATAVLVTHINATYRPSATSIPDVSVAHAR
jgi:hypothetical protein